MKNYHLHQQRDLYPDVGLQLVVADAEVIKLGNWLDPELELDPQLGLQLLWAEFELEAELQLTEVADVESRRPHLELKLEPGS